MAEDSSEKVDTTEEKTVTTEKVDTTEEKTDTPEKVDTTEEKTDIPEKVDTTEENTDTTEKVDTIEEKQPEVPIQAENVEPAPEKTIASISNSTDSLLNSGSDGNKPITESAKEDSYHKKFSSSSGSEKNDKEREVEMQFSNSTLSEKKDNGTDDKVKLTSSSGTAKRVAFDEDTGTEMSESKEWSSSEDQRSSQKSGSESYKSLQTKDSTTMTMGDSDMESANYSEFVLTEDHLKSISVQSESMSYSRDAESMSSAALYSSQAHELVNMVIANASKHLLMEQMRRQKTLTQLELELSRGSTPAQALPVFDNEAIGNIDWLTIEEFTVDRGTNKIEEFIKKTWYHQDNWLYCTDHLGKEEFDYDTRYRYRVRWSVPTRRKPIPRATASVYFTFSVSKVKPRDYPVDVYYVFETNRLVHRPGESRFREKWLKDIIESKVITMNGIHF